MDGDTSELEGLVDVARAHREHERFHSLFKLEEAVAWRRDANALKLLSDRWSVTDEDGPRLADPDQGAVGCADLNDPAVVATTGILFMEGASEPAELTAMRAGWETASMRYGKLSVWLAEHMSAEWPRLTQLLTPDLAEAARPRFMALSRTTAAGHSYSLVANLLTTAAQALTNQDLTPAGVRSNRDAAAQMVRTAAWLVDTAAAEIARTGASLTLSDPDWTEFIRIAERKIENDGTE
ncbi:hypothetical protein JOF29_007206 [Kribbella aluminosa]|uniref:Uncharacterized protein n=2 Tax=Kribbella aluminosa TaxID=416017 RepID=A0ABS4UX27_9ACTN|nr:hypothetical protein [Kribbella aluminosa]MBP2356096.1 hypothetical protein [Kribbella aluminosa]